MFTNHFKMTKQPFAERIPVEQILRDERMNQGLARLQYMVSEGTVALITGLTGIGKSILIKLFLSTLSKNQFLPVYVHFTNIKTAGLLNLIVTKLGEAPKPGKQKLFIQLMEKANKTNLNIILIVDEAHLLNSDALTDLRLLVSSAIEEVPPLKIILAGQERLREQLKRTSQADFDNRISVHCRLKTFTKTQTDSYIDFQMKYAGASDKVFEPEVKNIIHDYANGIPRQINNIAVACLINAAIQNSQKINIGLMNQTMAEFK